MMQRSLLGLTRSVPPPPRSFPRSPLARFFVFSSSQSFCLSVSVSPCSSFRLLAPVSAVPSYYFFIIISHFPSSCHSFSFLQGTASAADVIKAVNDEKGVFIDVRPNDEFNKVYAKGFVNMPLANLAESLGDISTASTVYLVDSFGVGSKKVCG